MKKLKILLYDCCFNFMQGGEGENRKKWTNYRMSY
jgi:hypothetical protein